MGTPSRIDTKRVRLRQMIIKSGDLYKWTEDLEGIVRKITHLWGVQENPQNIDITVFTRTMEVRWR